MGKYSNKYQSISKSDILEWPSVLEDSLTAKQKEVYINRKQAVVAYIERNETIDNICSRYGIKKSEVYRLLKRCLETHTDGRLFGFRALIPYMRVQSTINAPFEQLLEEHPSLKDQIEKDFLNAYKKGEVRERNLSTKTIHQRFMRNCIKLGIGLNQYPLNTQTKAYKSVERYLKSLSNKHFVAVAARSGEESKMLAKNTGANFTEFQTQTPIRPYEKVEFDGHKIDVALSIKYTTPAGDEIVDTLNRIWILSIIDVATRCILGYHLCLNKEYSSDDVLMCIRNAIKPWKPKELTIPNLKYSESSGFPSYLVHEAAYGIWDEFCYDNAKANLAKIVQDQLNNFIGCSINMGPVATPISRPHIERFFRTLEQNGFQRMVSTTGNNPKDPKKLKNNEKIAVKYNISVEHIEELVDVLIAEYNTTPHFGLSNITPLEALKQRIERGMNINTLSESKRDEFLFFTTKIQRVIRGDVNGGRRAFINYEGVRYTNDILANSTYLIGKKITILVNIDDIRFIKAFLEDGSELGKLSAIGKWGIRAHSLRDRKSINKLHKSNNIQIPHNEDPIDIYHQYLSSKAKSKDGRNKLIGFEKNQESKRLRYTQNDEIKNKESSKETDNKSENNHNKPKKKLRRTLQT